MRDDYCFDTLTGHTVELIGKSVKFRMQFRKPMKQLWMFTSKGFPATLVMVLCRFKGLQMLAGARNIDIKVLMTVDLFQTLLQLVGLLWRCCDMNAFPVGMKKLPQPLAQAYSVVMAWGRSPTRVCLWRMRLFLNVARIDHGCWRSFKLVAQTNVSRAEVGQW